MSPRNRQAVIAQRILRRYGVKNILRDFPKVTCVSSNSYSKLWPQHIMETGYARPAHHPASPLFGKKPATAKKEFKVMERHHQPQLRQPLGRAAPPCEEEQHQNGRTP